MPLEKVKDGSRDWGGTAKWREREMVMVVKDVVCDGGSRIRVERG